MNTAEHRLELARFLRARRARLLPAEVGLPPGRRRRTPGLRREEVAAVAGIGVTWYTRLEQGRTSDVSSHTLQAIARALCLNPAERGHLARLAHDSATRIDSGTDVSPAVRAVVTMVETCPAYVCNCRWDLLLSNRAGRMILGDIPETPDGRPNLLWRLFTDAAARRLHQNWQTTALQVLAEFQASYVHHASDPRYSGLVEALRAASPEFAGWWDSYELRERGEWTDELDHPVVGRLVLQVLVSVPAGQSQLRLLLQAPKPGSTSAARLAGLLGTEAGESHQLNQVHGNWIDPV